MTRFYAGDARLPGWAGWLLVLALASAAADPVASAGASPWRVLAPGLEFARFELAPAVVEVLRADPERWETVALAATAIDGGSRSIEQWARDFGLTAAINAGMYADDGATHVGYFRTGQHVNNGTWNQRDYRQAACFEPREPGLPRFVLMDLDHHPENTFEASYEIVIQNLRLIRKNGENRWNPGEKRWSEACLGEDDRGRMLWIYCRKPLDMHALNELLLSLPLGLVAAQHLEGGRQARLWIDPEHLVAAGGDDHGVHKRNDNSLLSVPLPNVLGIRPRPSQ